VTAFSSLRRTTGLALLTFAAALSGCDKLMPGPTASFKAVDVTGAEYGRTLALPDADGKPRTLADFKGKVSVVFFGYTHCPDVCPTTLAEIAEVKAMLGKDGERVQAVFVTVDPERDTPELLKAYMANFGPGFVALRGTPEQTAAAAREFKVFYMKAPGKTEGSYTVDHTAGSYIIDAQGRLRLFARYGMPAADLAADLKQLVAEK
jgi:protein SCO1